MRGAGRAQRVVLISGPSGAGLSTALAALQDLGFETVDNIPLSLVCRLTEGQGAAAPLAIGLDGRNREFCAEAVLDLMAELSGRPGMSVELLFLDCSPKVLERRFSETRRRHPLAPGEDVGTGIARDMALTAPLRGRAGALIDTSELTVHDLRAEIARLYAPSGRRLAVTVLSFSYRRGLPTGIDLAFDCRVLPNPHWVEALRPRDGRDAEVAAHALSGPVAEPFVQHTDGLVRLMLAPGDSGARAHLGIGFGCTGGKHRSVAMTERLAAALAEEGWQVSKRHRELERHAGRAEAAMPAGRGA